MCLLQDIYKLVIWFVGNIKRIIDWVSAVLDSLSNIANGVIGAAIQFIVAAMRKIIPVILDFFAKLLNISGIVDAVKNTINLLPGQYNLSYTDSTFYWDTTHCFPLSLPFISFMLFINLFYRNLPI